MTGFFEDIEIGSIAELGSHKFTAEEIIGFAQRFDPQPFHLSEEAARTSLFGHLCASGWHTACIWMRLLSTHHAKQRAALKAAGEPIPNFGPSPGFRDMTWPLPVYADDVVQYTSQIQNKRPLKSRPDWGLIESLNEGINQNGDLVMRFTGNMFVDRRTPRSNA